MLFKLLLFHLLQLNILIQQNVLMFHYINIDTNLFVCTVYFYCSSIIFFVCLYYLVFCMFYIYDCFLRIILWNLFRFLDFFFLNFVFMFIYVYLHKSTQICSKLSSHKIYENTGFHWPQLYCRFCPYTDKYGSMKTRILAFFYAVFTMNISQATSVFNSLLARLLLVDSHAEWKI